MGYIADIDRDPDQCHEGWVAMTYADGKVSSGTSNGLGHYLDGYTYTDEGNIDPAFLRPYAEVMGWLPRCECGWAGVVSQVPDDVGNGRREPTDAQEQLVMDQWRLHLRYDVARAS